MTRPLNGIGRQTVVKFENRLGGIFNVCGLAGRWMASFGFMVP